MTYSGPVTPPAAGHLCVQRRLRADHGTNSYWLGYRIGLRCTDRVLRQVKQRNTVHHSWQGLVDFSDRGLHLLPRMRGWLAAGNCQDSHASYGDRNQDPPDGRKELRLLLLHSCSQTEPYGPLHPKTHGAAKRFDLGLTWTAADHRIRRDTCSWLSTCRPWGDCRHGNDGLLSNDCDLPGQRTPGHRSAGCGIANVWTCNERHLDGGRSSPDRSEIGCEGGTFGIARRQSQDLTVRDVRRSRPGTAGRVVPSGKHQGRTNCHARRGHALGWLPPHVDCPTRTLGTGWSRRHPASPCRGGHCHG